MRPAPYFFALGLAVGILSSSLFWNQKADREAEAARKTEAAEWAPMLGKCQFDRDACLDAKSTD